MIETIAVSTSSVRSLSPLKTVRTSMAAVATIASTPRTIGALPVRCANSAVGGRSVQTWLYDSNVTSTKNSAGECIINPNTFNARWNAMLDASTGMRSGDYLIIHRGILHRYKLDLSNGPVKMLVMESRGHVRWPKRLVWRPA